MNDDKIARFGVSAEETWRVFRIMAEFVEGFEELATIGPAVSIFGSVHVASYCPADAAEHGDMDGKPLVHTSVQLRICASAQLHGQFGCK